MLQLFQKTELMLRGNKNVKNQFERAKIWLSLRNITNSFLIPKIKQKRYFKQNLNFVCT